MINQIKKIMVIALCTMAMHGVINAVSQIGLQKARGLLEKEGLKPLTAAEEQNLEKNLETKLRVVDDAVKKDQLTQAYKAIEGAEDAAEKAGFFQRWFIDPTKKVYNAIMSRFVEKSKQMAELTMKIVIKDFAAAAQEFYKVNQFMDNIGASRESREKSFNGLAITTASQQLPGVTSQVNEGLKYFKQAITNVNALSLAQMDDNAKQDFTGALKQAFEGYNLLLDGIGNDLSIMNVNQDLIKSRGQNQYAFAFDYQKGICAPVLQTAEALVELKEKEQSSDIKLFTPYIQFDKQQIQSLIQIIGKMNNNTWTKMDLAKWAAGTLLAGATAYYVFKNRTVISDTLGLPAAADYIKSTQLAQKVGAAVSGGTAYILKAGGDVMAYMPTRESISTAWINTAQRLSGAKDSLIRTLKMGGSQGVSVVVHEIPSDTDLQEVEAPLKEEQEGIQGPNEYLNDFN